MQRGNHSPQSLHLANPIPPEMIGQVIQYANQHQRLSRQILRWVNNSGINKPLVSTSKLTK